MARPDFDDHAVFSACLAGDEAAWRQLMDRYSAMVWSIAHAHGLPSHDCHDVHQSTWTNVLLRLAQLRSPDRLSAWIAATARHECLKHIKRGKRHLLIDDVEFFDIREHDSEAPEDEVIRSMVNQEVKAAFKRLPTRDQYLLEALMSDYEPRYDVVSKNLGIPRGSIGPLRRRALTRLRNLLPEGAY